MIPKRWKILQVRNHMSRMGNAFSGQKRLTTGLGRNREFGEEKGATVCERGVRRGQAFNRRGRLIDSLVKGEVRKMKR